jgi:uncharacterized membrane protein YwzB
MSQITQQQVDKLIGDIETIKSVISENQPILKQLLLPMHFRVISYLVGIGTITISMAYFFLLRQYGGYDAIPQAARISLLVVIICLAVTIWILKGVLWFKSVHAVNKELRFGQMLKTLYSGQILHTWIPIVFLLGTSIAYCIYAGQIRFIVPALCFGVGIIYNMIGGMIRIRQYLLTGYWLIITGVCAVIFANICSLIWLALSLGVGMLLFAFLSKAPEQKQ